MSTNWREDFPPLTEDSPAESLIRIRFRWYSRQATKTRLIYQALGLAQLVAALFIAVSIAIDAPTWLAPALGGSIALAEGIRTLFGLHDTYPAYRRTAEALRNEAWLYVQRADRYADAPDAAKLLAERVVELSSEETAEWASALRSRRT
jgi:hypothetical protein